MSDKLVKNIDELFFKVKEILESARTKVFKAANSAMLQTYWHIGREIVEEEQKGKKRAEYGKQLMEALSKSLTQELGKGFLLSNLFNMRKFYP